MFVDLPTPPVPEGGKTYRLSSNPLVYTPGILVWWQGMAQDNMDQAMHQFGSAFPAVPEAVREDVLTGALPVEVEDESVIIAVPEDHRCWENWESYNRM